MSNQVLAHKNVSRISISLPEALLVELDKMVLERGFENRSQVLSNMIHQFITEQKAVEDNAIMSGTINLVYDHSVAGLQKQLTDLQHEHIDEVISSLHVHLMNTQTMEVILVQGPGSKLQNIADKMQVCRGVLSAKLQVATSMIPPLHPLPHDELTDNEYSQRCEQEIEQ